MRAPAASTINGELRLLKRGFNVLVDARRLNADDVPKIEISIKHKRVRRGFIDPPEFAALLDKLPVDLRDAVAFLITRAGAATKCELWNGAT